MRLALHPGLTGSLIISLLAATAAAAEPAPKPVALLQTPEGIVRAPLFSSEFAGRAVAQVDDRIITLHDLTEVLAEQHTARAEGKKAKSDVRPVLDRLIATQLILLEAHEMGIDELEPVKAAVATFAEGAAREVLKQKLTARIKPDAAEVTRLTQEATREWKVRSILFTTESDARAASIAMLSGKEFDALAREALASKKAASVGEAQLISAKSEVLPQVLAAIRVTLPRHLSAPVQVPNGWTVLFLDETRTGDDAEARVQAEQQSLERQRGELLRDYYEQQMKERVHLDRALLEKLDFEARRPGFDQLAKDSRVLVRFEGGEPVRVSDLASHLRTKFFHGIESAIKEKKVQKQVVPVLNELLYKRIFAEAAQREKISQSPEFAKQVGDYRDSLVFGTFIDKVISPELKVMESDGKAYYEAHKADFTYPEYFSLLSLDFATAQAAQAAADQLRAGTDFKWLKVNAPGQLPEGERTLDFNGGTVSASSLDAATARALTGAKSGDVRLLSSGKEQFVLLIKKETPPEPQPYVQTREVIAKKVTAEKVSQAIADWGAKLRKLHAVKVFLTEIVS